MNGMFAFAIWDKNKKTLFLARDRLGIKPLYYYKDSTKFLFASEIKSILEHTGIKRQINNEVIEEFLFFRYVAGEETFFKDIYALLPGHYLICSEEKMSIKEFWSPNPGNSIPNGNKKNCLDMLEKLIIDSIKIRLMSEVPLGTLCSGGIDSSLVSAYAAMMINQPLETFSVGFYEKDFDETNYARLAAQKYNTNHHEIRVSNEEFSELLPRLIWHNDEPLNHPNSIQIYCISKYAKQFVTVILTGEGADEVFVGYPRYLIPKFCYYYDAIIPYPFKKLIKGLFKHSKARKIKKIHELLDFSLIKTAIFASSCVDAKTVEKVIEYTVKRNNDYRFKSFQTTGFDQIHKLSKNEYLTAVSILDLKTYLVSILNRQDKMSMAASIESRVPLLDYRLVELSLSIPFNLKLRRFNTKFILKKLASQVLPKEIVYRKKSGFGVPLDSWFRENKGLGQYLDLLTSVNFKQRGYFKPIVVEQLIDKHLRGLIDCGELLWELINFEIWANNFIDS